MTSLPPNALAHLHDESYARSFEARNLDHRGLIAMGGRETVSLAGPWIFTLDPFEEGLRQHWYKDAFKPLDGRTVPWDGDVHHGETIDLPCCWTTARPDLTHYEGTAWFGRWLEPMPRVGNDRVFLRIGAANYDCKLFLDGRFIGHHRGGSTPFFVELSGLLEDRAFLHIAVDSGRRPERVPMHHIDWFNHGGLFREIELLTLPEVFVKESWVRLEGAAIACDVALSDPLDGEALLRIEALGIAMPVPVTQGHGAIRIAADPQRWSPDQPQLYEVSVSFGDDRVNERIGFREIRTEGRRVLLNGEDVFLKGVCVHEDDVALGRVTDEADIRRRFAHAKELGCNFLRLTHYPHHERVTEIADEVGLMLWAEIPVYWAIAFDNPDTLADAENQLQELILRDRNRASVVAWGVGNENADDDHRLHFMRHLADTARALDPTRLVGAACLVDKKRRRIDDRLAAHLDLVGINEYYGWYDADPENLIAIGEAYDLDKPIVITEFGADAPAGRMGDDATLFSERHQAAVFERQFDVFARVPAIRGCCPWLLYDFRTLRRSNSFQRGFNRKGLIAEDKETRKAAFSVVRRAYSLLR